MILDKLDIDNINRRYFSLFDICIFKDGIGNTGNEGAWLDSGEKVKRVKYSKEDGCLYLWIVSGDGNHCIPDTAESDIRIIMYDHAGVAYYMYNCCNCELDDIVREADYDVAKFKVGSVTDLCLFNLTLYRFKTYSGDECLVLSGRNGMTVEEVFRTYLPDEYNCWAKTGQPFSYTSFCRYDKLGWGDTAHVGNIGDIDLSKIEQDKPYFSDSFDSLKP